MLTCARPALGERQSERPHAGETAAASRARPPRSSRATSTSSVAEIHVERDQGPPRADDAPPRRARRAPGAEVRRELARVDAALELLRPTAPVERGPRSGATRRRGTRAGRARRRPAAPSSQRRTRARVPCPRAGCGRSARRPPRRPADARLRACAGRSARARTAIPATSESTSDRRSEPTSVKTDRL